MGTRYVIAVMKVEEVEESANQYDTRDTTLFEATHTDPARLARFAPEEVLAVLAEAAGAPVGGLPMLSIQTNADQFAFTATLEASVPEEMTREETATADDSPTPATEKPKRSRRTKAQIEADKAAQAAGYRDAAHQEEAQAADVAIEDGPVEPIAAGGMPTPTSEAAAAEVFGSTANVSGPWPADQPMTVDPFRGNSCVAPGGTPGPATYDPFA